MKENEACMVSYWLVSDRGVQDYIRGTRMNEDGMYGTDVEIFAMAYLMHTLVLVYKIDLDLWQRHSPAFLDPNFNDDVTQMAMYIRNPSGHFDVVLSVSDPPQSEYKWEYSRASYKVNPDPKKQSKFDTLYLYVWFYRAGHSFRTMFS